LPFRCELLTGGNVTRLRGHNDPFTVRVAHAASFNETNLLVCSDRGRVIGLDFKSNFRNASVRKVMHPRDQERFGNTTTARVRRHSDVQELCVALRTEISRGSNEEHFVSQLPRQIEPANPVAAAQRSQHPQHYFAAEDGASLELAHGTREQRVASERRIQARGEEGFRLNLARKTPDVNHGIGFWMITVYLLHTVAKGVEKNANGGLDFSCGNRSDGEGVGQSKSLLAVAR